MDVCIKDQSGSLPGKTIIFAMTKEHADRIRQVFEEMFPQYPGLLQVIYHDVERVHDGPYGDGLISKFKKEDKPRLAVSVDMLDTGIDVPEVVNLVFMKPIHSRIKLWQMIGRGTRNQKACHYFGRLPNGEKTNFLIIDFWQNDFGRQTEERVPSEMPVLTRVFNTRLDILAATLNDRDNPAYAQAIADCRATLARVPTESFLIRKAWPDVELAWTADFWTQLTRERLDFLRLRVAPLLRFVPDVDVAAETFTNKVERLALAMLRGAASAEQLSSIAEDVRRLPQEIRERTSKKNSARVALSADLAQASRTQLTEIIRELAPEMKNKRRADNPFLAIDLPDFVATAQHVIVMPNGTQVHVEEYRKRIDQRILRIAEEHPALRAVRDGDSPTADQLIDLERVLHNELESSDINFSDKTARAVSPRPRNDPNYYGGKFPFIQTGDISDSGGRLRSWTQTLNEKGTRVSRSFPPGTIVIAIVGATIGVTAILETEVYCPDSVVGIQVDSSQATKEYIEFLLRFWRPIFLAQAPETARANINLDTLRPLRIPVPPLSLQQKFSTLVERTEQLRSTQRESLRQADHLFQTLLHQAFTPQ
jgi:type I restriction enzyme R subunit